jgi:hypothetical protein
MFIACQLIVFYIGCAAVFLLLLTVQPAAPDQSAPNSPTSSRSLLSLIIFACLMVLLLNFLEHMRVDEAVEAQNLAQAQALGALQKHVNELAIVVSEAEAYQRNSQEFLKDQELVQRNTLAQLAAAVAKVRGGSSGMVSPAAPGTPVVSSMMAPLPAPAVSVAGGRPNSPPIIPRNANEKRLIEELNALEQERDQLVTQQELKRRNYEDNRVNERDSARALALAKTFNDYSAYMEQRITNQNNKIARRILELKNLRP